MMVTLGKYLIHVICVENCFTQKFILVEHMRVHIGERLYNYDVYEYIFAQNIYTGRAYKGSHWENVTYIEEIYGGLNWRKSL